MAAVLRSDFNFPKFIKDEDLPLVQGKVDILQITEFFRKAITPKDLNHLPLEQQACFHDQPFDLRPVRPIHILNNDPIRRAIAFAQVFFNTRLEELKMKSFFFDDELVDQSKRDFFTHLGRFQRMELVSFGDSRTNCSKYVFGDSVDSRKIQGSLEDVLAYLRNKGYSSVDQAAPDQIVLYFTSKKDGTSRVEHYGIVRSVNQSGEIFVTSKWGEEGPIYIHPLEGILKGYGNCCIFLNRPQVAAPAPALAASPESQWSPLTILMNCFDYWCNSPR